MPLELNKGILGNRQYQERNSHLRQDSVRLEIARIKPFPTESGWYNFTTGLMKRSKPDGLQSLSSDNGFAQLYQDLRERIAMGFDEIWEETRRRLEAYRSKFDGQWSPISDRVLSRMSELVKTPWAVEKINVHFVDCLFGGFGWNDCIGFTPFHDMEVQKKFLAHELSELLTPHRVIIDCLQRSNLDPGIAHTVVDMIAYFSVREFVTSTDSFGVEKKGIRPNPTYYPKVDLLFPAFERYAENPSVYPDFRSLMEETIDRL